MTAGRYEGNEVLSEFGPVQKGGGSLEHGGGGAVSDVKLRHDGVTEGPRDDGPVKEENNRTTGD